MSGCNYLRKRKISANIKWDIIQLMCDEMGKREKYKLLSELKKENNLT